MRAVFSNEYPDPQLKGLHVSTSYPLKREDFPAVVISYDEGSVKNAGVSHEEYLETVDGFVIPAKHFMFEGSITFKCLALSPLDIDILTDSVAELLAFGRLDSLLNKLFDAVYVDVPDTAQITFYSDYLDAVGDSVMETAWGSEDGLVYQNGYRIRCSGGFYNAIKEGDVSQYIEDILIYGNQPFEEEQELLTELFGRNSSNPYYVRGRAVVSSF